MPSSMLQTSIGTFAVQDSQDYKTPSRRIFTTAVLTATWFYGTNLLLSPFSLFDIFLSRF
jgi:hypothetical protein